MIIPVYFEHENLALDLLDYWIVDHQFGAISTLSWVIGPTLNTIGGCLEDTKKKGVGTWLNNIGALILTAWFFFAGLKLDWSYHPAFAIGFSVRIAPF